MFLVRSVCLSVCLSVGLSVCPSDYSQTCEQILTKFSVGVGHGSRTKWYNFGGDPDHASDPGVQSLKSGSSGLPCSAEVCSLWVHLVALFLGDKFWWHVTRQWFHLDLRSLCNTYRKLYPATHQKFHLALTSALNISETMQPLVTCYYPHSGFASVSPMHMCRCMEMTVIHRHGKLNFDV